MPSSNQNGISLFELLVVLAMVSLLSTLAYPKYINYMAQAKRLEGRCALLELGNCMETYAIENATGYTGADLQKVGMPETTERGYYRLSIQNAQSNQYTIIAVPTFLDPVCTQLSYNERGEQLYEGTGGRIDCWGH